MGMFYSSFKCPRTVCTTPRGCDTRIVIRWEPGGPWEDLEVQISTSPNDRAPPPEGFFRAGNHFSPVPGFSIYFIGEAFAFYHYFFSSFAETGTWAGKGRRNSEWNLWGAFSTAGHSMNCLSQNFSKNYFVGTGVIGLLSEAVGTSMVLNGTISIERWRSSLFLPRSPSLWMEHLIRKASWWMGRKTFKGVNAIV